jgi:hypothetical protein
MFTSHERESQRDHLTIRRISIGKLRMFIPLWTTPKKTTPSSVRPIDHCPP